MNSSAGPQIERLIQLLAKLPGLGPRSARRAVLRLLKNRDALMDPLVTALVDAQASVKTCATCGNLDTDVACGICRDPRRDDTVLCVVEQVSDLWAMERGGVFRGRYHVLGGVLSALDGIGPEDLKIGGLVERVSSGQIGEVILALDATVEGQTTAHYLSDRLTGTGAQISGLAHGVPVGGELDYLDDGTIAAALSARRTI